MECFLQISPNLSLTQLSDRVGSRNVRSILTANQLSRNPKIGPQLSSLCTQAARSTKAVPLVRKQSILNSFQSQYELFELACLLDDNGWKVLANLGTFPGMLRIPEDVSLPFASDIYGLQKSVDPEIYGKAMDQLSTPPYYTIDPAIFQQFTNISPSRSVEPGPGNGSIFEAFHMPWGSISLYSSLAKKSMDFPVYPESVDDGVVANYTTMPDMLYQYEPWQMYTSSGPRTNTYEFDMHRDMWTGDHRDGRCNELIRFCEANCYPMFNGSAVNTSIVTLYVKGSVLISGVLTDVTVNWDGPIGQDGWYLHCKLKLTITEISQKPLDFNTVLNKGLIG